MTNPTTLSNSTAGRAPALVALRRAVVDERDGPLPALLLALTVLAGDLDATSILRLGHVFVAAMTGNLVFLGLAAAGARGFATVTPALAVGGFVVGVVVGGRACRGARSHRGRALRNVLAVKAVLAGTVTLIAFLAGGRFTIGVRDTVVVLLAISMGSQLAAIRYLKVPDLLTVVLTLTLTGALTERGAGWHDPAVLRRGLALVAFAVGAMSGALLIRLVGLAAALAFGLGIILAVGVAAHVVSQSPASWSAPRSASGQPTVRRSA